MIIRLTLDTDDLAAGAQLDESTPFMDFWRAINRHHAENGKPEIMQGEANRLWEMVTIGRSQS